jgi:IS605 OrfB family transposase
MAARRKKNVMTRAYRVFLDDLNQGKSEELKRFLRLCHDVMQYFMDLHWQRQDFSARLGDLPTIHCAVKRFGITTRLSQALCKQAKEFVASTRKKFKKRKPRLRRHVVTLFYHFVTIEPFNGKGFDWCIKFIGSGAPKMICPIFSTKPMNQKLADGWIRSKTIRLGLRNYRVFIDLLVEKQRPQPKAEGKVVGMDSNYKNGLVFSDGQNVATELHQVIQGFAPHQKHTRVEMKSMMGWAIKQIDFSQIKMLVIEDLKKVKHGKRGTFSRVFNRRLSHWLYAYTASLLVRRCQELGIEVERKDPWKTSQRCHACGKWDKRNRRSDRFLCVNCGHFDHADLNASKNLEFLGLAGMYGFRLRPSSKCQSFG